MFVDARQAARIERAEAALASAIVGALPDAGAWLLPVGGGVAAYARPGSPMNKLIGVGFEGPVEPAVLDRVEARMRAVPEAVRLEIATLAGPEVLASFAGRGYGLRGFENVLGRTVGGAMGLALPPSVVAVRRVEDAAAAGVWGEVATDGFAHPDGTAAGAEEIPRAALEEVMRDFAAAPGVRRYLALVDGTPAGAASCRFEVGVAQLCGATTLPAWRRRGVQRALLAARLADAADAGCDLAVVTTAPGSQSQANVQRLGFALLYSRAVLIKDGD